MQSSNCAQNEKQEIQSTAVIQNHLRYAILTSLICFPPFGIISIVNAAKVPELIAAGNYAEAKKASNNAKKWSTISIIVGIVNLALFIFFLMIQARAEMEKNESLKKPGVIMPPSSTPHGN